jgi:hypothetical protein
MGDTNTSPAAKVPTRQTAFDYDRTLVADRQLGHGLQ